MKLPSGPFALLGALSVLSLTSCVDQVPPMIDQPGNNAVAFAASDNAPPVRLGLCKTGQRNTPTKTCLVDGDTLWLAGTKYRLKGFDTPEPQSRVCGGDFEKALAKKASNRALQLLNGNAWTIETFGSGNTGQRTLATIRINGRDLGDILISENLARRWPDGSEWWCQTTV